MYNALVLIVPNYQAEASKHGLKKRDKQEKNKRMTWGSYWGI